MTTLELHHVAVHMTCSEHAVKLTFYQAPQPPLD